MASKQQAASQKKSGRKSQDSSESGGGPVQVTQQFLRDCNDELKKVVAPTRQETLQATLVTLVIVGFVAAALAMMDFTFMRVMGTVLANRPM